MWFSKTQQPTVQKDSSGILAVLQSNGITLSIEELLQYQNKTALIDLAASKDLHGHMSGNYLARSKGRGMEFDEVRHYQTGDDIRAIDWRVTARTGKTHTKLFREEVERPVLITTDLSASMSFGSELLFKSVQAAHLAALVAWHAKSRGDRIGGIVFNQVKHLELKPRSRRAGVLHYLHALTQLQQPIEAQGPTSASDAELVFEQNCTRIRQLARPGSLVYMITDGQHLNSEAIRHLTQVTRHCELVVCLIDDPLEVQLPGSQVKIPVALTDGLRRQYLTLGDAKTAEHYQYQAQQASQQRKDLLAKAGARLLSYSAAQTLESQLKNGVTSWIR